MNFETVLEETRLVAILRGVTPKEILNVAAVLINSGFKIIEIPLNSPDAFNSIEILSLHYKSFDDIYIGAGTVCKEEDVERLYSIGAKLVVSPNIDKSVILKSIEKKMISVPGFLTPTEAYSAIKQGARYIKLFPFKKFGLDYYKDIRVVLPLHVKVIVVGGVDTSNIENYLSNGIKYFGLGSSLYKPNMSLKEIKTKADSFIAKVGSFGK